MGMKTRNTFAVAIETKPCQIRYVTSMDYHAKMALWEAGKKAQVMPHAKAQDIAMGLRFNGYTAFVMEYPSGMEFMNPEAEDKKEEKTTNASETAKEPRKYRTLQAIPNELAAAFHTEEGRAELIRRYQDNNGWYSGINEDGERVILAIDETGMTVQTFQANGWVRINYYDAEGAADGESFDGRWKTAADEQNTFRPGARVVYGEFNNAVILDCLSDGKYRICYEDPTGETNVVIAQEDELS